MASLLGEIVWNSQSLAVIGAFAVPLSVVLAIAWYSWNRARAEIMLKRVMVERGMSADEIERVIAAGKDKEESDAC